MSLSLLLLVGQIIISFLLIGAILLQQRGTGIGSAFGGDHLLYASRRGIERILFWGTVVLAALFLATAFLNLLI